MATPVVNGPKIMDNNAATPKTIGQNSSLTKESQSSRNVENGRKTLGGHDDGSQRRGLPKPWSGPNPNILRSNASSHPNGNIPSQNNPSRNANGRASLPRQNSQKSNVSHDTSAVEATSNNQLIYFLGSLLGVPVRIVTKSSEEFTGLFAGSEVDGPSPSYLLKMVKCVKGSQKTSANGAGDAVTDYIGAGSDHSMIFNAADVAGILADNVPDVSLVTSQDVPSSSFPTDSDISGNVMGRERPLQKWQDPSSEVGVDMALESTGESTGGWDQFQTNEQRFGLKSDYNEDYYTTKIDTSHPLHQMRKQNAERIARSIEGDTSVNAHVREERGLHTENDGFDEEERYSGVSRNGQSHPPLQSNQLNKYMPPARRQVVKPSATVSGSSLDPAIISSQIARPSSKSRETDVAETTEPMSSGKPKDTNEIRKANVTSQLHESGSTKVTPPKSTIPNTPNKAGGSNITATENVETELLDSFRQFASLEKMRVQDSRRIRASQDKAVKVNDLKKFAKNFKLNTPVPKDLVPILAKDKSKQEEIMEKARQNAEQGQPSLAKLAVDTDQKTQRSLARVPWDNPPMALSTETSSTIRDRQGTSSHGLPVFPSSKDRHPPQIPSNQSLRGGQGFLSQRLAATHTMHKAGIPGSIPAPLPIQDARVPPARLSTQTSSSSSPQKQSGVRSPTSAVSAKFNVKAMEFKPNPNANTFKPTADPSVPSSRRSSAIADSSRASSPPAFFGDRKPLPSAERPSILANFNPLKYLKAEAEKEKKTKEYAFNGGIQPAHKTPPTWNPPKEGEEFKSYKDMFGDSRPAANGTVIQQSSPGNLPMAHQHQLPLHLQNGAHGVPQVNTPHHGHHHPHAQPHHYQNSPHHYDDHHMRPSASSSSVYPSPSPRMQPMAMYPSPMSQHAQLAYGQPMPQYVMGPHGPQPAGFRQFPGGPQMIASQGPHLAAPIMVQQPSNGGLMGLQQPMQLPFNPQMAIYPGGNPQPYGMPSQSSNGFPSPGRGAPMMIPQGSQQGHHQNLYMAPSQYPQPIYAQQPPAHMTPMRGYGSPQPHFNQSPYQQHQHPHQPHRTPSSGHAQLYQGHHQHVASQQIPPPAPMDMGEEAK